MFQIPCEISVFSKLLTSNLLCLNILYKSLIVCLLRYVFRKNHVLKLISFRIILASHSSNLRYLNPILLEFKITCFLREYAQDHSILLFFYKRDWMATQIVHHLHINQFYLSNKYGFSSGSFKTKFVVMTIIWLPLF